MIDWFLDKCLIWLIVAFIAFMFVVMVIGAGQSAKARADFMTECQQDHKEYECTAMWRAGESHSDVVPMPIIMPSGRR